MNVSLVIADLNIRGGTHKQLTRLAEYLSRHGCRVTIHTFDFDPTRCFPGIQNFRVYDAKRPKNLGVLRGLWRAAVSAWRLVQAIPHDVDIINVHDLSCYSVMLLTRLLRRRARIVWQINDFPTEFHVGPGKRVPPRWSDALVRMGVRAVARLCDSITVNVGKNQRLVSQLMGVEALLYYPGVDQAFECFRPRTLSSPLRLVSVGVFLPYRNYEVILDAMEELRKRGVMTELTLVGGTDLAPAYAAKIAELASHKQLDVRITGEVDEQTFSSILTNAHVFLFVNLDQSWGLAVFEAMNMSLPVIVSESVGAVELVRGCLGVRLVDATSPKDVANAIEEVTVDSDRFTAVASAAFDFSTSLGWEKLYCPDVYALFRRLLSH